MQRTGCLQRAKSLKSSKQSRQEGRPVNEILKCIPFTNLLFKLTLNSQILNNLLPSSVSTKKNLTTQFFTLRRNSRNFCAFFMQYIILLQRNGTCFLTCLQACSFLSNFMSRIALDIVICFRS